MIIDISNPETLKMCAVCISETSGGQLALLIIVALISIPIISVPGNKYLKHALEWDYFVGVISFYLLTFFMWKKN